MTDVDEVFEDETETNEPEEKVVEGEVVEEVTGEESEEKSEEETEPPADKEPTMVPIAALHDTRRKLDEARERAEALEKQIPVKDEAPDMYEDPDGYKLFVKNQALAEVQAEQNAVYEARVEKSRSSMLEKHEDYEQMEKTFVFLTGFDETLISDMKANVDPAQFAYDKAKEYMVAQKEVLISELIASGEYTKKEAEEEAEEQTEEKVVNAPSLAKATSVASNTHPVEKDYANVDEMFGDQKY